MPLHLERFRGNVLLSIIGMTLALLAGIAACSKNKGTETSYAFEPPLVDSTRVYVETVVDNAQNTMYFDYKVTVTAIGDNGGTITEHQQAISGPDVSVNGTHYLPDTETQTLNGFGRELGFSYTGSNGKPGSCSYSPYAGGPEPPLNVGQTWDIGYTESCDGKPPTEFSQRGSVVDVETVDEPAGEFTALKLQSTTSWTDSKGTTHVQTTTNWLDVTTLRSVRQSSTYVQGGKPAATGYAVSRMIELQSSEPSAATHESPRTQ